MKHVGNNNLGKVNNENLLKANEIATILNISISFVYKLMKCGDLPTVHLGRAVLGPRALDASRMELSGPVRGPRAAHAAPRQTIEPNGRGRRLARRRSPLAPRVHRPGHSARQDRGVADGLQRARQRRRRRHAA